jgi:hypothetical protein
MDKLIEHRLTELAKRMRLTGEIGLKVAASCVFEFSTELQAILAQQEPSETADSSSSAMTEKVGVERELAERLELLAQSWDEESLMSHDSTPSLCASQLRAAVAQEIGEGSVMKRTAEQVVQEWRDNGSQDWGDLVSRINYWTLTDMCPALAQEKPREALPLNYCCSICKKTSHSTQAHRMADLATDRIEKRAEEHSANVPAAMLRRFAEESKQLYFAHREEDIAECLRRAWEEGYGHGLQR